MYSRVNSLKVGAIEAEVRYIDRFEMFGSVTAPRTMQRKLKKNVLCRIPKCMPRVFYYQVQSFEKDKYLKFFYFGSYFFSSQAIQ